MARDEYDYKGFVKSLKSLNPRQIHLFYGPEVFLFEESLKKLKLIILGKEVSSFNFAMYYGDLVRGEDIRNAIQTLPLFGSNRMVVVKGIEWLEGGDLVELTDALEDIPELSYVVLHTNNDKLDGRLKLVKLCKAKGTVVNLRKLLPFQLALWIKARAKDLGLKMNDDVLEFFMTVVDNDLWNIENELVKLATYQGSHGGVVTEQHVKAIVASATERNIFDVIDAISEKDKKKALLLSFQMLRDGTPVPLLLALIVRQLTLLLKTKVALEENPYMGPKEIARVLGIPPYAGQKCIQQHKRFTLDELQKALTTLSKTEKAVKTGEGDGKLALELAILSIVVA